ncbi:MAG: PilW family protein [Thermodesulfovibrionales bacterium]
MIRRMKQEEGFTLVELMITMVIFVLALAASSQMFVGMVTNFKQQSRIAESNIEGLVGLELMRYDIEQAGFGLFWNNTTAVPIAYNETGINKNGLSTDDAPNLAPRAFVLGNDTEVNGSDYLVIKSTVAATSDAAQKWTHVVKGFGVRAWGTIASEEMTNTDRMVVLSLDADRRIVNESEPPTSGPATFFVQKPGIVAGTAWVPNRDIDNIYVAYGVSPTNALRMPFNRADYYIRTPAAMPQRCAPNTGMLYKASVNHSDGALTEMPIMDCVVDMQVVFSLDTNADNTADLFGLIPGGYTARQVREQVKEVRVYIVTHDGQIDAGYTYTNPRSIAGSFDFDPLSVANQIDILDRNSVTGATTVVKRLTVPNRNYRWKAYNLILTPYNLR